MDDRNDEWPPTDARDLELDLEPDDDAIDADLIANGPCPECGAPGACEWDLEGRPLIHPTLRDEEEPRRA